MKALGVWMDGRHVATLARRGRTLSLAYTPDALALGVGRPLLSVSMPTRVSPYNGAVPHAFFEGLLPEGDARRMIAYDFGVADTAFDLLAVIGRDCAGALVILPEGEAPAAGGPPEPIGDAEVAERIRRLPIAPLGVDQKVRASLAGMQQKLLLARAGDGWALPANGAPSTHIVKPPSLDVRFPQMVANEALCLRIARHLGLRAAEVELADFDGLQALVIERYDRTAPDADGHVARIHQEDFCQAHGHDGTGFRKYEVHGGPSLQRCARTLALWSREADQLDRLLDLTTLNVMVGNADAHARNSSLLHHGDGRVELAPVYDVFASAWYPEQSREPGMHVNGVRDITAVTRGDLVREAEGWGIRTGAAADRVHDLLARADDAITRAAEEIGAPGSLVELILARVRGLAAG